MGGARRGLARVRVALDWCVSPYVANALAALYARDGFEFLHLKNIPGAVGDDVIWADVFKQFGGRIVLSGDHQIGVKPHEASAFIDNGFLSFFPEGNWAQMKMHEKAAALVYWWPKVREVYEANKDTAGGCWRIPFVVSNGILRLERKELEPMVMPEEALEKGRKIRGK
jgi:hypothetical protein